MKQCAILLSSITVIIAVMLMLNGCGDPTVPCGTLTFTGSPHSSRGINAQVDFNFNPGTCSSNCNCNTICYIQIVRIIDRTTGAFLSPNTDQTNRIVTGRAGAWLNGWAIDRLSSRNWGYYGRNNDNSFASTIVTGSNTSVATLFDTPSGWPNNSWFDAVTVPVCIQSGSACVNRLLGYEYWLFIVDNSGTVGAPFSELGRTWMRDSFNESVIEWNADAPGLGKNSFPAMSPL
jgi:hypothetical protein